MPLLLVTTVPEAADTGTASTADHSTMVDPPSSDHGTARPPKRVKRPKAPHGQYFTTHPTLHAKVNALIRNAPSRILEPSSGRGDLVEAVAAVHPQAGWDCYELDERLPWIPSSVPPPTIGDFLQRIPDDRRYATIVGNPPYVQIPGGNLYIAFVRKCVDLLADNGELVFIVPSEFFTRTSAAGALRYMLSVGNFTDVWRPHREDLFANASVDVMVFRYEIGASTAASVCYNDAERWLCPKACLTGIVTFQLTAAGGGGNSVRIDSLFDVYVGIVSGKDAVFKHDSLGNLRVRSSESKVDNFVCAMRDWTTLSSEAQQYLSERRAVLETRRIQKRWTDANWYQWGALRNVAAVNVHKGKACLYVKNTTRNATVCFEGRVEWFGGSLLMLVPKLKQADVDLSVIRDALNTPDFVAQHTYAGRFKIGHRVLCHTAVTV